MIQAGETGRQGIARGALLTTFFPVYTCQGQGDTPYADGTCLARLHDLQRRNGAPGGIQTPGFWFAVCQINVHSAFFGIAYE